MNKQIRKNFYDSLDRYDGGFRETISFDFMIHVCLFEIC